MTSRSRSSSSFTPTNSSKAEIEVQETTVKISGDNLPSMSPVSSGTMRSISGEGETVMVAEVSETSYCGWRTDILRSVIFWVVVLLAVAVGFICWWVGGTTDAVSRWNNYTKVAWADNLWVLGVFLILAMIVLGIATFLGARASTMQGDMFNVVLIYVTFALQLILTPIAYAMIFRQRDSYITFFFSIGLLLVTANQFYLLNKSGSQAAVWLIMVYLVWVLVETFIAWNIYVSNP